MKLFVWKSVALANYSPGCIIALANEEDEARTNARQEFEDWLRAYRSWLFIDGKPNPDPDTYQEYVEELAKFESDLAKAPNQSNVILIQGSD